MQIDLTGDVALILGPTHAPIAPAIAPAIVQGIAAALQASGARLATGTPRAARDQCGRLDLIVHCATATSAAACRSLEAAVTALRAGGGGRLVTLIGPGAAIPRRGHARQAAAAAALAHLTRALALDAAAASVRVNAVAIGPGHDAASHIPTGRPPSLRSITNAVLFLLAPAASYVTGHILTVDGGFSAAYVRNF